MCVCVFFFRVIHFNLWHIFFQNFVNIYIPEYYSNYYFSSPNVVHNLATSWPIFAHEHHKKEWRNICWEKQAGPDVLEDMLQQIVEALSWGESWERERWYRTIGTIVSRFTIGTIVSRFWTRVCLAMCLLFRLFVLVISHRNYYETVNYYYR